MAKTLLTVFKSGTVLSGTPFLKAIRESYGIADFMNRTGMPPFRVRKTSSSSSRSCDSSMESDVSRPTAYPRAFSRTTFPIWA